MMDKTSRPGRPVRPVKPVTPPPPKRPTPERTNTPNQTSSLQSRGAAIKAASQPLQQAYRTAVDQYKAARDAARALDTKDARKAAMEAARAGKMAARETYKTGMRAVRSSPGTTTTTPTTTPAAAAPTYVRPVIGLKSGGCVTAGRGGKFKGTM